MPSHTKEKKRKEIFMFFNGGHGDRRALDTCDSCVVLMKDVMETTLMMV